MLILKRRYEWWMVMLALCKIGAIVIPATHMLTKHDIVYRNTRASVKAIICVDDAYVTESDTSRHARESDGEAIYHDYRSRQAHS